MHRKRFLCAVLVLAPVILGMTLGCHARCTAGEKRYPVSTVAPGLRGEADAVIRRNEVVFDVKDAAHARMKVTKAVTIYSKDGRHFGTLGLSYGRFVKIADLDGRIYDDAGEEVRALEDRDMHDFSNTGEDLYSDNRGRTAELYHDHYPYTVEYTYEYAYEGILGWPGWSPQESSEPVEYSRFEITLPDTGRLRYWVNRDSANPAISLHDGRRSYLWEARNLPELKGEMLHEDLDKRSVVVLTAPSAFRVEDYTGDMSSWQTFGRWYAELYKDRALLPESARRDILAIVLPTDPVPERVRKVYAYMQGRTRYVSVQLGLGGWQPFDPTYVHERGYGDCKALSNYTVALLKGAGVQAYPVLIRSGSRGDQFYEQFPSQQFNHVIVCVPAGKDSLWLECTSHSLPAGRITDDNEDRYGLLVSENGGTLVRTPRSSSKENAQRRFATVGLYGGGGARASVRTTYTGDQHDDVRLALTDATPEDRKRWINDGIRIANCRVDSFSVQGLESHRPEVTLLMELSLSGFASSTESRIFFQPNLMERRTSVPREFESRLSPVRMNYPYYDADSVVYRLPQGFVCEALPKEVSLSSSFGSYAMKAVPRGDSLLVYTRLLEVREATIPPERYREYRSFFGDIVKADRAQAVLVRKAK